MSKTPRTSYNTDFVGRQDVFDAIMGLWQVPFKTPRSMLLWGERNTGKSSILYSINERCPEINAAHLNLLRVVEIEDNFFWSELAYAVQKATNVALPSTEDFLLNTSYSLFSSYIHKVVQKQHSDRKMLLIIDEYEKLEEFRNAEEILYQLSSLTLANPNIAFILCGAHETDQLSFRNFKTTTCFKLGLFTKKECAELIGIQPPKFEEAAIERIYELTNGQPYLVKYLCFQLVCNYKWNLQLDRDTSDPVTVADVNAVAEDPYFYQRNIYYFTTAWNRLTAGERIVLKLVANAQEGLTLADLTQKIGINTAIFSICGLINTYNLLKKIDDRYCMAIAIFQRWIIRT
jgi:hypothetical protein